MLMWKRNRKGRPDIRVPDDTGEAEVIRQDAIKQREVVKAVLAEHRRKAPAWNILGNGLIERLPENHFVEAVFPRFLTKERP